MFHPQIMTLGLTLVSEHSSVSLLLSCHHVDLECPGVEDMEIMIGYGQSSDSLTI